MTQSANPEVDRPAFASIRTPERSPDQAPGRHCPVDYYYGAASVAQAAPLACETAWIVGGLYGNPFALDVIEQAFAAEVASQKRLVFNGDFHWFDAQPDWFASIQARVSRYDPLRGNVESECARPAYDAAIGCGCAYPNHVSDEVVNRSNRILGELWQSCNAGGFAAALAKLPMYRRLQVGAARVAVVHGDLDSLAGWTFDVDLLATDQGFMHAQQMLLAAPFDVIASSHTCAPLLRSFDAPGIKSRLLANNGAAGMPNFHNDLAGVATRVGVSPLAGLGAERLKALRLRVLHSREQAGAWVESVALDYDSQAWWRQFSARWPEGSDAHASYGARIQHGCTTSAERVYA